MSLTEIIVDFAEPRQKVIEARPVVSDILLQHLDIGLMPDLCTIALHQNDLNVTNCILIYLSNIRYYLCIWKLLENNVPQSTGWLVYNRIDILIHLPKYLISNFPLEEVDIVLQIVLKSLLIVMNAVAKAAEGICHGLGPSFRKTSTDHFHYSSENIKI